MKTSLLSGLAAASAASQGRPAGAAENPVTEPCSRVALTAGDDRADNVFQGLKAHEQEIARAIGHRRVIIKPNNVSINIQLSASHVDCLEGILEFLKSIGKADKAMIAESAANGPTLEGFANYGYPRLRDKYGVRLVDLDQQPYDIVQVFDETDFRPHPVRMSRLLLDPGGFVISAAVMKTHDLVVATLSLKNIIFGAPIKDPGYGSGKRKNPDAKSDKRIAHGGGIRGINYNLFALGQHLHPHLAVIDGYDGMEGYGPTRGTAVGHRVCVVSPDWLAADRVAVELMGIDFAKIGYLNYCADAGLGQADLNKIEVVGEPIARHMKNYQLAPNIDKQLIWMKPPEQSS